MTSTTSSMRGLAEGFTDIYHVHRLICLNLVRGDHLVVSSEEGINVDRDSGDKVSKLYVVS